MDIIKSIYYWLVSLIYEGSRFASFLIEPLFELGGVSFSMLTFVTFGGLSAFLGVAVVKWIIS